MLICSRSAAPPVITLQVFLIAYLVHAQGTTDNKVLLKFAIHLHSSGKQTPKLFSSLTFFLQGAEMRLGWRSRQLVNSSEKVKISYVIQKLVFLTLPISHKFFCRNMSKNFLFPTRLMDGRGKVISELFFFSFFFACGSQI